MKYINVFMTVVTCNTITFYLKPNYGFEFYYNEIILLYLF